MSLAVEKEFVFTFSSKDQKSTLKVPVTIPLQQSASDLVGRLVAAHNLPCYVEDDLKKSLEKFVDDETWKFHDENAEAAIAKVRKDPSLVDGLVDKWSGVFKKEVKKFADNEAVSEEEKFADVYHTLIHSPALETLLNLEHEYACTIEDLIDQRDRDLQHLENSQRKEMETAVQNVGVMYTDDQINQLAQRHFENTQLIDSKWSGELSNVKESQKKEYREWVMTVHQAMQTTDRVPAYLQRVRALSLTMPEAKEGERSSQSTTMEESFTIHLGAQMKTTHNLRLLCTDVLDLCRHKPHTVGGVLVPQPQRLQTAMSLYSSNLSGLILLVDNRLNYYTGLKRDFAKVCEMSTDFHFPAMDQQFAHIEKEVVIANEFRVHSRSTEDGDSTSIKSGGSGSSDGQDKANRIQTGDFYMTKHSNLAEVHVLFHLVCDDSIRFSDMTSRHPVILSIRNIIKLCFRYDITTITIPLLLAHDMSEEMTIPWCMKRAELIFKCVKGFVMEMSTYSAQESRTIQFLVPRGMSEEMFASISAMLPSIFRLSNSIVVKSSSPNSA
ncbi:hypothetical protein ScPMuIL_004343 [Solemya velum]